MYDWLVVGAGLYGATFARDMTDAGKRCLVVEKRDYIGGNCADEWRNDILVPRHGGHIFHTNDKGIWEYANRFAEFTNYRHRVMVSYDGKMYSFPINLMTLAQVYGVTTPTEAAKLLKSFGPAQNHNLRDWVTSQIGPLLYGMFFEGYTKKQWGRDPAELPASIARRIPIRLTYNDDYFSDEYQGMPVGGYSRMIGKMLEGINVITRTDYIAERGALDLMANKVCYTGPLDLLYNTSQGALEYRSLRWIFQEYDDMDYQGAATVNYTSDKVAYTRILEFKHFWPSPPRHTIIAREYPAPWSPGKEPYYPINDTVNNERAAAYMAMARADGLEIGGRLAKYRYYDMHQVIAAARAHVRRLTNGA